MSNSNPQLWARAPRSPLDLEEDTIMLESQDRCATVVLFDRCYNLDDDNNCLDYENRPATCIEHPRGPGSPIAGCGFYFLEFHDNDEIAAIHRAGVRRKPI